VVELKWSPGLVWPSVFVPMVCQNVFIKLRNFLWQLLIAYGIFWEFYDNEKENDMLNKNAVCLNKQSPLGIK